MSKTIALLEQLAPVAHSAVVAHFSAFAVQKYLVEVLAIGDGSQVLRLLK